MKKQKKGGLDSLVCSSRRERKNCSSSSQACEAASFAASSAEREKSFFLPPLVCSRRTFSSAEERKKILLLRHVVMMFGYVHHYFKDWNNHEPDLDNGHHQFQSLDMLHTSHHHHPYITLLTFNQCLNLVLHATNTHSNTFIITNYVIVTMCVMYGLPFMSGRYFAPRYQ